MQVSLRHRSPINVKPLLERWCKTISGDTPKKDNVTL